MRIVVFLVLAFWGSQALSQSLDTDGARARAKIGSLVLCDPYYNHDASLGQNELNNSLWARHQKIPGARTYYILGAPWCPYCKSVYKMALRGTTDIEFRFILQDPRSASDVVKMADLAMNGTTALARIFGDKPYKRPKSLSDWDVEFFGDAALFNSMTLQLGWEAYIKEIYRAYNLNRLSWASPVTFEVLTDGQATFPIGYVGMPSIHTKDRQYKRAGGVPFNERPIAKSPPRLNRTDKQVFTGQTSQFSRVYALPDPNAPALCIEANARFDIDGIVRYQNRDWYRIVVLSVQRNGGNSTPILVSGYTLVQ